MKTAVDHLIRQVDRRRIADAIVVTLAETYLLSAKTRAFFWNVSGPFAGALRPMFEAQHRDMEQSIDDMAVRLRFFGQPAPSAFMQLAQLSSVREEADVPDWRDMVSQLVQDQDVVVQAAKKVYAAAELSNDTATLDLMARRISRHERNAWELRSLLE